MNCEAVRQHLLASERPDQPTNGAARHLLSCPACRAWHYRLTRLERQLARLPAPAPSPPAELLKLFREGGPLLVRPPRSGDHPAARLREFGRRKLALASSLAAALTLFALGWWALPPRPALPPSALETLQRQEPRLAQAATPAARARALADLAEEALAEAERKLDDPVRVRALADRFDLVVRGALLPQANEIAGGDHKVLLEGLATRLREAESKASRLAHEAAHRDPTTIAALERIAVTARTADGRLRELARKA